MPRREGATVSITKSLPPVTLVLGGARSGKSAYAEGLVADSGLAPVYLATATSGDDEMSERVRAHRERRGDAWTTIEEPLDIAQALSHHSASDKAILVDCLTLWLSNLMTLSRDIDAETERLVSVLPSLPSPSYSSPTKSALGSCRRTISRALSATMLENFTNPLRVRPTASFLWLPAYPCH